MLDMVDFPGLVIYFKSMASYQSQGYMGCVYIKVVLIYTVTEFVIYNDIV